MEIASGTQLVHQKVAAALLIIQVVVVLSVFVGAVVSGYWSRNRPYFLSSNDRGIFSSGVMDFAFLLLWLLSTIVPILLTPFFKIGWDALGFNFHVVEVRTATWIAMLANILFCTWFIFRSGGWSHSPFVSVIGALPVFAILIGEPITRTLMYVVAISIFMGVSMVRSAYFDDKQSGPHREHMRLGVAAWLLATTMLLLTTALGYIRALPFA